MAEERRMEEKSARQIHTMSAVSTGPVVRNAARAAGAGCANRAIIAQWSAITGVPSRSIASNALGRIPSQEGPTPICSITNESDYEH